VAELHRRGERAGVAIEVVAFSDEEGARFHTSFLSSRTLIGRFEEAVLARHDEEGVTLDEALRGAGLDPTRIPGAALDPSKLAAYLEVHIEQGPVLLDEGFALGVVTSIASGTRFSVRVKGEAGHAGTVPMKRRRDALVAAAEMVVAVEREMAGIEGAVGTVGVLHVKDGTGNVIPGDVEFSVDVRAPDDARRSVAEERVLARLDAIAQARNVAVERSRTHDVRAAACAPWIQDRLAASIERCVPGKPARRLPSGAGHDAMILAQVTDVGMLFVRCGAGGVSHNPAETVDARDAGLGAEVVLDFLRRS
jgi:allantoate deiminase/N-carbamoyl-L-amino-acid hydrolase